MKQELATTTPPPRNSAQPGSATPAGDVCASPPLSVALAALFGLLLTGAMALFMWRSIGQAIEYSESLLAMQTDVLAGNLAYTGAQSLMLRDYVAIEQLAINAIEFPGIDEVKFTDTGGTILSDVSRVDGKPQVRFGGAALAVPPKPEVTRGVTDTHVVVWQPVLLGELQGWVRVSHNLAAINAARNGMWTANVLFGSGVVLVAVFLVLAILRRPMRVLQTYAGFAERLDSRAGRQLTIETSSRELDQLGMALNRTSRRLHEQNVAINDAIADLERLAAFPEQSPDIVLSLTSAGALQYINPQGREILAALDLRQHDFGRLLPDDYLHEIHSCRTSGTALSEIESTYRDRHFVWTFAPLGSRDLVHCYGRDISQRRKAEELARSAVLEKSAAEASSQAKSMFLATMSHEIRTPLTAIIGYSDAALDAERTTEQRLAALRTIRSAGDHLLALINDILDFSKIEAGALDIERTSVNLIGMVTEVESIFAEQAHGKGLDFGVDFTFPVPATIVCDPVRLKQVLINLCGNAIKFTDRGSVRIALSYDQATNEIGVAVSDTGIGMSTEQLRTVFRPFRQGDASTSRRFGGTGLGLALSQRIVELLGGRLVVRTEPGNGSTFSVFLRLTDAAGVTLVSSIDQAKANAAPHGTTSEITRCTGDVLVAEDNITNQELIAMYLDRLGVRVVLAGNGAEAVAQARQRPFDLIFMDMQMPVMSGVDAVRELRAAGYDRPIVMLTANATLEDRKLCSDAGCDDFVTKPIARKKLYEVSARYLDRTDATTRQSAHAFRRSSVVGGD
jgi:signal transduction histidine kinase/CheY-like chemotaxis protein